MLCGYGNCVKNECSSMSPSYKKTADNDYHTEVHTFIILVYFKPIIIYIMYLNS